jgi:N-acyl-D-amino-acid deacylase
LISALSGCASVEYDVVVRGGAIHDGTGAKPFTGDVAVLGGKIAAVGALPPGARGKTEIDARGRAVAPGFVNMLSHSEDSLIIDGRGQSDLRQGVTLEVLGEGSMGPLNEAMRAEAVSFQKEFKYDLAWSTLGGYLEWLERRGISPNVASFVGASTVREYVLGYENRSPSAAELDKMRALVAEAMDEGAVGVTTALIYPPAVYSTTEELVELAKVASARGGVFSAHMRSEGGRLLEGIDEMIRVAREAKIPVEIYHLKVAGRENWGKLDAAVKKIEAARAEGLAITADMYLYTAGATALASALPPWTKEGGYPALEKRLGDPEIRARIKRELGAPSDAWENLYRLASPEGVRILDVTNQALARFLGKSLTEVARMRGESPEDALMNLVVEDKSATGALYFIASEDNIRREVKLPWVSFCSDEAATAPEGVFLKDGVHPRAYGNFARLLGTYVRKERALALEEAIRRLTSLPAATLHLEGRGKLEAGYWADVVVFDPATIEDHATYDAPRKYATGVGDVLVNGVPVLRGGEPTAARPGRAVRSRGWKKKGP